jgi:hypothetical protein
MRTGLDHQVKVTINLVKMKYMDLTLDKKSELCNLSTTSLLVINHVMIRLTTERLVLLWIKEHKQGIKRMQYKWSYNCRCMIKHSKLGFTKRWKTTVQWQVNLSKTQNLTWVLTAQYKVSGHAQPWTRTLMDSKTIHGPTNQKMVSHHPDKFWRLTCFDDSHWLWWHFTPLDMLSSYLLVHR